MNIVGLIIVLTCGFLNYGALEAADISGYYWRDYGGTIPYDAVPGGLEGGRATYVGQALFKELIVPAKIVPEEKTAYFEWGFQTFSANQTVKVLCTNHPEYVQWANSATSEFGKIQDKHFIVAGYEPGGTLYVGRQKNDAGDIILGKLLFNKDGAVLHSAYRGQAIMHWDFQALYFDFSTKPNKNSVGDQSTCKACTCDKKKILSINLFCD